MGLADLQSWLLREGIRDDLDAITLLTVRMELDNLTAAPTMQSAAIDWPKLLLAGSILARSEQRNDQEAALRIATAAISLTQDQALKDAGAVLLGKLSNFRAIELATDRKLLAANLNERLGVSLRLEAQRRVMNRSILVQSSGVWGKGKYFDEIKGHFFFLTIFAITMIFLGWLCYERMIKAEKTL
jgi:hypothetical protein